MVLLIIATGSLLFSQAPEFAQQYRQRLGGAIDELTTIIQSFDAQANHAGLDRQAALNVYAGSPQPFLRSQGDAMRRTFERYEVLSDQLEHLLAAPAVLRPVVILRHVDAAIASSTARHFVPGVPVSFAGLTWAAIGATAGAILALFVNALLRAFGRLLRPPRSPVITRSQATFRHR